MQITVIAVLCHAIAALPQPVCREEIVTRTDAMASCIFSQPALADWKAHSIYQSEAWTIAKVKCVPGPYVLRDAI